MDYEKLITQLESGNSLDDWKEVPSKEMLEDRLAAMRQLQGIYEREARILCREQEELGKILATS